MTVNLLEFQKNGFARFCAEIGEKPFRARQLERWIHQNGAGDFEVMTDIPKALRSRLGELAEIRAPRVVRDTTASDGTRKWLLDVGTGNAIESVFIPERNRGTLCISSQAGCALECTFCSTGRQGFNRNLSVAEIIGQLWLASNALQSPQTRPDAPAPGAIPGRRITNVVMMGMGEPLANFDNVVAAMQLMLDDDAYGLSRRRVTLSTSGLVPAIDRLRDACPVALAVSLHAPDDRLRDELVPINRKYPIEELMDACVRYAERKPRTSITFEYTMMKGINDKPEHARALAKLMRQVDARVQRDNAAKVNLIPFNPFPGTHYERSEEDDIRAFQKSLLDSGVLTMVRRTRGDDIDAACGQLKGQVVDRTRRQAEFNRKLASQRPGGEADAA